MLTKDTPRGSYTHLHIGIFMNVMKSFVKMYNLTLGSIFLLDTQGRFKFLHTYECDEGFYGSMHNLTLAQSFYLIQKTVLKFLTMCHVFISSNCEF